MSKLGLISDDLADRYAARVLEKGSLARESDRQVGDPYYEGPGPSPDYGSGNRFGAPEVHWWVSKSGDPEDHSHDSLKYGMGIGFAKYEYDPDAADLVGQLAEYCEGMGPIEAAELLNRMAPMIEHAPALVQFFIKNLSPDELASEMTGLDSGAREAIKFDLPEGWEHLGEVDYSTADMTVGELYKRMVKRDSEQKFHQYHVSIISNLIDRELTAEERTNLKLMGKSRLASFRQKCMEKIRKGGIVISLDDIDKQEIEKALQQPGSWTTFPRTQPSPTITLNHVGDMSNEKEDIEMNVQSKDGHLTITRLDGRAPEPIEPEQVTIAGNIEAPAEYFRHGLENDTIDTTKAHVEVDKDQGRISLHCDPSSPIGAIARGAIKWNPLLHKMGVNNFGGEKLSEDDIVLLLKETRSLFMSQASCNDLINKIKNIESKVTTQRDKNDDERGSRSHYYEQVCETDLPDSFTLETHIFVSSEVDPAEYMFDVQLKYHYAGELEFWLESPDLQEIVEGELEAIMQNQINQFEDHVPVIYK